MWPKGAGAEIERILSGGGPSARFSRRENASAKPTG